VMLYKYLIEYRNAAGEWASIGGLMEPGVNADHPLDAARKAFKGATRFVRRRCLFISVRPHGSDGVGACYKPERILSGWVGVS
jgi:hypothetical protein